MHKRHAPYTRLQPPALKLLSRGHRLNVQLHRTTYPPNLAKLHTGGPLAQGCSTPTKAAARRVTSNRLTPKPVCLRVHIDGCGSTSTFMLCEIFRPRTKVNGHQTTTKVPFPSQVLHETVNILLLLQERFVKLQPEVWACIHHVYWQFTYFLDLQ